ncbi:MAG: hypothetical protein FWF49_04085 [Oscillospiraceae bacterium]|nr:hypothetical protein [Oscillospiraceae bacterium]
MSNARSMLFGCWAILIVLLLMAVVFLRSKKKGYAAAILPLILVPVVHIAGNFLAVQSAKALPLDPLQLRIVLEIAAGLIACVLLGFSSRAIKEKRSRLAFFISCAGFVVVLDTVLIFSLLAPKG